ncbi:MAG: HAD family hydrolase [Synergistaceae bacterium]|jgi:phosphoglycolate phosphatase-like HAD superfamily hydrolase|nr:HAD family hydrolase [Synergistaceae bacterium]
MVFPGGADLPLSEGAIEPDCLIFDVDGVLVEAGSSFPETIRTTVEGEWKRAGFAVDADGYTSRHNDILKRHGSFNDDYDIAWILLNIMAWRGGRKLSESLPDAEELEKIIAGCEGDCAAWALAAFPEAFGRAEIREICVRTYFGDGQRRGTFRLETPLLRTRWDKLPLPAYIYTGRNLEEWRLAQKVLSWLDFPDERVVSSDSGILKPSPGGLAYICEKFGRDSPLFFGDTASDKKSFDAFGRGRFIAIGGILRDENPNFACVGDALASLLGWEDDEIGKIGRR